MLKRKIKERTKNGRNTKSRGKLNLSRRGLNEKRRFEKHQQDVWDLPEVISKGRTFWAKGPTASINPEA